MIRSVLVIAGIAVLLMGCRTSRPVRSEEQLREHRARFIESVIQTRKDIARRIIERAAGEAHDASATGQPQPAFDVLILSGGGDYGSFGAGVLKGWEGVTDEELRRPFFDLVSGVSTGALIAPFAFAGTPEAYERAYLLYQDPKPEWFRKRGLLTFLLRGEPYVDNSGLKREIERAMDQTVIDDIARGASEKRILLIGTTNLDMGMMRMFDIGEDALRAASGVATRERLDKIIPASASIPGAFPPVEIDGDLYVDGGVTRNIAYTSDQDYPYSALNLWLAERAGKPLPKVRFWVIINNHLGTPSKSMQPAWQSLMARSLEMSIRSSTIGSLKALFLAMKVLQLHGHSIEFRYIAIPDDWRPPVEGTFQKETMTALALLGRRLGADPKNWRVIVPDPGSPTE